MLLYCHWFGFSPTTKRQLEYLMPSLQQLAAHTQAFAYAIGEKASKLRHFAIQASEVAIL